MKKIIGIVASFLLLFTAGSAQALNTQGLRYYFPGGRALSLIESKPLPMDTLTLGFGFNYSRQPLEFGNSTTGARVQGIVDDLYTFDFMASYSFSDRFALAINLPVHVSKNVQSIAVTTFETNMNLGDILLSGIYNVISADDNSLGAGFSVAPFVSFPSGKSSDFVGDQTVTGGFLLVGDIDLNGHYLGLNLGLRLRDTENFLNMKVASEFLYTAAYHHSLWEEQRLSGFAEFAGSTVMADFLQKANESPFEARLGLTKAFLPDDPLKVTLAGGFGAGNGFGAADYRFLVKVTYDHFLPRPKKVEVIKYIEKPSVTRIERIEKELKELTIYYPTDGDQVDPFYDQKIAGIAQILRDNPDLGPLYIIGHTDDVGSDGYNQKLSEKRAKKAAQSITASGLNPNNIVWIGLGEKYPVVQNSSDANRALNRRTLFTFIKPPQLEERYNGKNGYVGINTDTGKKNDSYTEVLKALETQKTQGGTGVETSTVTKTYKDSSEVTVDTMGDTQTKDKPSSLPQNVDVKPRSKKYYKEKVVPVDSTSANESGDLNKKSKSRSPKTKKSKSIVKSNSKEVKSKDLPSDTQSVFQDEDSFENQ